MNLNNQIQLWQIGHYVVVAEAKRTVLIICDVLNSQGSKKLIYETNDGSFWSSTGECIYNSEPFDYKQPQRIETADSEDIERYELEEQKRRCRMLLENTILTSKEAAECAAAMLEITQRHLFKP